MALCVCLAKAACTGGECKARTDGPYLLQQASRHGRLQSQLNVTPTELMPCAAGAAQVTQCMTLAGYDQIVAAVRGQLESLDNTCTASVCPQADWAGCVLRMAGHDFMDFANGQGGSDACTDMADPDNAGLTACLSSGEHGAALADVYQQFCAETLSFPKALPRLVCHIVRLACHIELAQLRTSLADFLVIAAEAVMLSTRARQIAATPGAASLDFRGSFRFGRRTALNCAFAEGRLPNPERGCQAVQETFLDGMGLD